MQHIYLIEDDLQLAKLIQQFLLKHGFTVDVFNTANAYLQHQQTFIPGIIICDIMLPDGNGFELFEKLQLHNCPIIFLTALDSVQSQIKGLDLGAHDYLIKPIRPDLLLAKIKAIIKHSYADEHFTSHIEHLRLDNKKQDAYFHDLPLNLNASEFDIIAFLAKNAPQPVSREDLFKHVIGREYDGLDRAIDLKVSRLRKKISDLFATKPYALNLKSVRGKGYSLDITKS